jgi:glycosyltransferase XagB
LFISDGAAEKDNTSVSGDEHARIGELLKGRGTLALLEAYQKIGPARAVRLNHANAIVPLEEADGEMATGDVAFGKICIDRRAFRQAICTEHAENLRVLATDGLGFLRPEFSANRSSLFLSRFTLIAIIGLLVFALLTADVAGVITVYGLAALFLTSSGIRLWTLVNPASPSRAPVAMLAPTLPVYTILVPLYDEAAVVEQMFIGLSALTYPTEKLDIMFLVEDSDQATLRALKQLALPSHFDVIVVPAGLPRTKPRALNFGLLFARGELLTIYDGEDIPQPRQLMEAVKLFSLRSPKTACLQAQLSYFNANENWLTRQFALEYAVHFGAFLPALARARLPMLLGGTSNHFRVNALRAVGGWDPYNVTEDADLGVRFARLGYHAEVLDSMTFEEAVNTPLAWLKQRSRWLKGLVITWLVHMRHPKRIKREIGFGALWIVTALSLGAWLNALLHPMLLAWCLWSLADTQTFVQSLLSTIGLVILIIDYAVYALLGQYWQMRSYGTWWLSTLLTFPLYWLFTYFAALLALFDLISAPFHWRKTRHGVSKLIVRTP